MKSPNQIFKDIILTVAREKLKCIRKREYLLEYYLNSFLLVHNDIVKWKSLQYTKLYSPKKYKKCLDLDLEKDYHYKTIQNEFNR